MRKIWLVLAKDLYVYWIANEVTYQKNELLFYIIMLGWTNNMSFWGAKVYICNLIIQITRDRVHIFRSNNSHRECLHPAKLVICSCFISMLQIIVSFRACASSLPTSVHWYKQFPQIFGPGVQPGLFIHI